MNSEKKKDEISHLVVLLNSIAIQLQLQLRLQYCGLEYDLLCITLLHKIKMGSF